MSKKLLFALICALFAAILTVRAQDTTPTLKTVNKINPLVDFNFEELTPNYDQPLMMYIKSTYGVEDRVDMGMVNNIWGGDYEHPYGVVNQGLLMSEYVDSTTNIPLWWVYCIRDPYGLATYEVHLRGLIIVWGDSDELMRSIPRPQIVTDTYNWCRF